MDQKSDEFGKREGDMNDNNFGDEDEDEEGDIGQEGNFQPPQSDGKNLQECLESFTQKTINLLEESNQAIQGFQQEWTEIKNNLSEEYNQQTEVQKRLQNNYHFVKESMGNFMSSMFNENQQPSGDFGM